MADNVNPAFDLKGLHIAVEDILPMKRVIANEKTNATYRRILSSIREIGLIEPLFVFPQGSGKLKKFSLLDGHTRFEALKALGKKTVPCLISTEDEAFTYSHKVNVVPPIQEHFMIIKAIESGVSEERIAAALDVDIPSIRQRRDLLNGVCPEAVELLKNKPAVRDCQLSLQMPPRIIESNATMSDIPCPTDPVQIEAVLLTAFGDASSR